MKALILIVSTVVFLVSGYVLFTDVNLAAGLNEYIYMSLLLILMLICVVGMLFNVPLMIEEKRRMKVFVNKKIDKALGESGPELTFQT